MDWGNIVKLLLKVVVWLVKNKLDDFQQQKLAREQVAKEAMDALNQRVVIAREVEADVGRLSDTELDERLRKHFREDDSK